MASNGWEEIWSRERPVSGLDLNDLIRLNGFSGPQSAHSEASYLLLAAELVNNLDFRRGDMFFEVGCGSGAFLVALQRVADCKVAGIDYSPFLVKVAREILGRGAIQLGDAATLDSRQTADFVISHSVFHYLDLPVAAKTLDLMCEKARKAVVVLDVPKAETRFQSESFRAHSMGGWHAYNSQYRDRGLKHFYYPASFFEELANSKNFNCRGLDLERGAYPQAQFRTDWILERR